jgi:hypothetical protein
MNRWGGLLREGMTLLPSGSPGQTRLAEHADFIEFVSKEFPDIFARWEQHRTSRR